MENSIGQVDFNFQEILDKTRKSYPKIISNKQQAPIQLTEIEAKKLTIEVDARKQFIELQAKWAKNIGIQIWAILIFQFAFIFLVGFNIFGFANNMAIIPNMYMGVILQNLANIIALGLVVTKFLFSQSQK